MNYAGLALIALGVLLIIAESFAPSFGTLGLGGIVSFVIGSVMLLDDDVPGFGIAWQLIGAMALAGSLVLLAIVSFAVRARRRPIVSGGEALLRERAEAIESFDTKGVVRIHGELWNATSRTPVAPGTTSAHPEPRRAHARGRTRIRLTAGETHDELCNAGICRGGGRSCSPLRSSRY